MQKNRRRVVWQDVRPVQPQPKPIPIKLTRTQKIKIKLSSLFKNRRKTIVIGLLFSILIIIIGSTYLLIAKPQQQAETPKIDKLPTSKAPTLEKGTPDYETILPTSKKINDLGGWTRISPPSTDPVYAYADKIDGVSITVSQQALPDSFKNNTEQQIEELSREFNASEKITIGNLVVHIGSSSEGPQSVIFSENNLLVLIKSSAMISNDKWTQYINSLH